MKARGAARAYEAAEHNYRRCVARTSRRSYPLCGQGMVLARSPCIGGTKPDAVLGPSLQRVGSEGLIDRYGPKPRRRTSWMSMRTDPKLEPDGSLVIYIQNESPGADKEANWLPSPKGKFHLMLRLYWPDEDNPSILDGSWVIPPVKRA